MFSPSPLSLTYVSMSFVSKFIMMRGNTNTPTRTHRERKELYIKALEQEVLHLKEKYASVARTKGSLYEENQRLKALLAQHGIAWNGSGGVDELSQMGHSTTSYASSSNVGSFSGPSSVTASPGNGPMNPGAFVQGVGYEGQQQQQQQQGGNRMGSGFNPAIDYDQAGIDFVLTYDPNNAPQRNPARDYLTPPPQ